MQIIAYQTEEEAQQIIQTKESEGLVLVEVQNITEGNFLGFKTPEEIPEPILPSLSEIELRVADLESAIAAILGGAM